MKKSELKQIIREEIKSILSENNYFYIYSLRTKKYYAGSPDDYNIFTKYKYHANRYTTKQSADYIFNKINKDLVASDKLMIISESI